jgi:hypothetical protein
VTKAGWVVGSDKPQAAPAPAGTTPLRN